MYQQFTNIQLIFSLKNKIHLLENAQQLNQPNCHQSAGRHLQTENWNLSVCFLDLETGSTIIVFAFYKVMISLRYFSLLSALDILSAAEETSEVWIENQSHR